MRSLFFIMFFIGATAPGLTYSQTVADTLQLEELKVLANRFRVPQIQQPVSIHVISSEQINAYRSGNLGNLLEAYAPVFVRSNGQGGLATAAYRGFSPSQTQVLWNGFALNHPMLGLTDLSLIPSGVLSSASVSSGTGGSSFGESGGATIALQTKSLSNTGFVQHTAGSFGLSQTEAGLGVDKNGWQGSVFARWENSDNDFTFLSREFSPEAGGIVDVSKRREHNAVESVSVLASARRNARNSQFETVLWVTDLENEIPGGISSPTELATQEDAFIRWMNSYIRNIMPGILRVSGFLNSRKLDFFDPDISLRSTSRIVSGVGEVELESTLGKGISTVSAIQFSYTNVRASDFGNGKKSRSRFSIQTNPVWNPAANLTIFGGIRLDSYNDFGEAISASVGGNVRFLQDFIIVKGNVSSSFTAPTFNDLFWPQLGNRDLNPERINKVEAGILNRLSSSEKLFLELETTFYTASIDDGIRWLPDNSGTFRPQNIESTTIRGIEWKLNQSTTVRDIRFSSYGLLAYNRAFFNEERFPGDAAKNKQLRLTPKWLFKAGFIAGYGAAQITLNYSRTGSRYMSSDQSSPFDPLDAYETVDVTGALSASVGQLQLAPTFRVLNLFDERFQTIRDFPQAGRIYQISIRLSINPK